MQMASSGPMYISIIWCDLTLKLKGCLFLDTWWFHLQHICLPTNILILATQGDCVGVTYIAVKLKKHKITATQRWSFYTGGH